MRIAHRGCSISDSILGVGPLLDNLMLPRAARCIVLRQPDLLVHALFHLCLYQLHILLICRIVEYLIYLVGALQSW